jgi:dimeric dUTPase (all-alpha-NTP-PPase superfamily)
MQFSELINYQKGVQEQSGIAIPEDSSQRLQALFAECGELVQSLKSSWRWWGHQGKEVMGCSREDVLAECADILHFLLIEAIARDFQPNGKCPWLVAWEDGVIPQGAGDYASSLLECLLLECLHWVETPGSLAQAVIRYVWAMRSLGFSQAEIESAYTNKADFNRKVMETIDV